MSDDRVAAGFYRGKAVEGSAEYGMKEKGEEVAIAVHVPSLGRNFVVFMSFSEAAAQYSIEKLRACGWTGDDVSNLVGIGTNEVDINIKYESWQGKERMKVDIYAGGGRVKLDNPLDEKQKRAFAARMKGMLKGNGSATPKPPAAAAKREGAFDPGPPDTGDEIPF